MPEYDGTSFDPPAPVAKVNLRHPSSGLVITQVPMLIDTGADVTLLPQAFVEQLGASIDFQKGYELMGFDGALSLTPFVDADLIFLSRAFKGRFLLTKQNCGILGRDVLNHLPLLFDGPRLAWTENQNESV